MSDSTSSTTLTDETMAPTEATRGESHYDTYNTDQVTPPAETERGSSAVAVGSRSRRNFIPLVALFVLICLGIFAALFVYQQHAAGLNERNKTGGTESSKTALASINRQGDQNFKKLGADSEDPNTPVVPAIQKDHGTLQPIPLSPQPGQNLPEPPAPRSRYDSSSSFDNPGYGNGNYGAVPPLPYANSGATTANRPDYSIQAPVPQTFSPQPYDKTALNLNTLNTPVAMASMIGNRDFILPKGAFIDCDLDTAINSTLPGMVRCTTTRDAYSDSGRVVLAGRGSTVTGEYRSDIKNGQARIQIIWNRIKTPEGVVIEPASPASDSLGRGGVDGDVNNHWFERIGAALLVSSIKDAVGYATARDGNGSTADTVYQNTSQAGEQMATQIMKETVGIPPTITRPQGTRVKIYLARDLDFSSVYSLKVIE